VLKHIVVTALLTGSVAVGAQTASTSREIDADVWSVIIDTVAKGDINRMAATYAPDAVLVSPGGTKAIKDVLAGWGRDMVTMKASGGQATVAFRFTKRQDNNTTAFETGIFEYTTIDKAGVRKPQYVPFEELLIKTNGKWRTVMERQLIPVTKAEWDALAK